MTKDQLFEWGAAYSFPFLVLTLKPQSCLLAGRSAWYSFLCSAEGPELLALEKRVTYWNSTYATFATPLD